MLNGMYVIEYTGSGGQGVATLTFKDGIIFGFDVGGGEYDGTYNSHGSQTTAIAVVDVKMPANVPSVIGGISQRHPWTLQVKFEIPTTVSEGSLTVQTNLGGQTVRVKYKRMRDLPIAA